MAKMDRTLVHDKNDTSCNEKADRKKPVHFPKLFRRLYSYEIAGKAKFGTKGCHDFLAYGQTNTLKHTLDEYVGTDGK